jgi:hypothetical protein
VDEVVLDRIAEREEFLVGLFRMLAREVDAAPAHVVDVALADRVVGAAFHERYGVFANVGKLALLDA